MSSKRGGRYGELESFRRNLGEWHPRTAGWDEASQVFASRPMANMWYSAKLVQQTSDKEVAPGQDYVIHSIEFEARMNLYRIEFSAFSTEPAGYWLQLTDPKTTFAVAVPNWGEANVRYLMEIGLEDIQEDADNFVEGDVLVNWLQMRLASENHGELKRAAYAWEKYRTARWAEAAESLDLAFFQKASSGSTPSLLAATVGAIILLRNQRDDVFDPYIGKLVDQALPFSDISVLWLEHMLHQKTVPEASSLVRLLEAVSTVGVPQTADGLSIAVRLADEFARVEQLTDHQKERVEIARRRLYQSLRFFRGQGLFSVFGVPTSQTDPASFLASLGAGTPELIPV